MILAMDSDTAGLRDRLAELEAEQATLEAELAIFDADYTREVLTVLAQLHDLQARVLGLVAGRSGEAGDAAAARAADARAQQTSSAVRAVPRHVSSSGCSATRPSGCTPTSPAETTPAGTRRRS